jgi:alkyl hydroperoxide reductase subunit AhpF
MYAIEQGVSEDLIYAYMWVNIASGDGAEKSKEFKKLLTEIMSLSDITTAQQMSSKCFRQKYKNCGN